MNIDRLSHTLAVCSHLLEQFEHNGISNETCAAAVLLLRLIELLSC